MDKLKVDLKNVGKTRYLYHEIFQIKDFQEIKNNGKLDEYKSQLRRLSEAEEAYQEEGEWGFIILFLSIVFIPSYAINPWLILAPVIVTTFYIAFGVIKGKRLKKERDKEEEKTTELTFSHPIFEYYCFEGIEYYSLVWKFNKLIKFLSKLDEYDDITVYSLSENLNYPTECDIVFRRLMFKDNKTGQFFIYAYSENDGNMTVLTIFDIDIDTFEYKPRTV